MATRHRRSGRHDDTARRLPDGLAATESPRAERARALLREAGARLRDAERHLAARPPDYAVALADELAAVRASLGAYLTWDGSAPVDEGADLLALAGRAVRLASVFDTSVRRARHLVRRAPALEKALRGGGRPSVADREDVETGWYTARNLYWTALGQVPGSLHPPGRRPASGRAERTGAVA